MTNLNLDQPAWSYLLARAAGRGDRAGTRIHLVGIGGSGLSAIAVLLLELGFSVSGSDQRPNEATDELARRGVTIYRGHHASQIAGADLVLISSAIPPNNPEVTAAAAAGIPVVRRQEFLGPLMEGRHGIGVSGTHGKTTTTGMIAVVLLRAGLDPSFIIGSRVSVGPAEGMATQTLAARAGEGPFVIEADEYEGMFLGLRLEIAVVTNVEWDHVDCYPTPRAFADAFRQFVGQLPSGGLLLLCADDAGSLALRSAAPPGVTVQTYGLSPHANWQAHELIANDRGGFDARVWFYPDLETTRNGTPISTLSLAIPGRHNVRNAMAALAVANWHGISPKWAASMLRDFRGAGRRFEYIGETSGVTVIDDYAHHPTEVAATLAAARLRFPTRRIWAVFQPHTYSRTQALLDDFAHSFDDADRVLLLDIYAAREKIDLGMHSMVLLEHMDHPGAQYVGSIEAAAAYLLENVGPEDIVITMSAGDGNRVGQLLLDGLRGGRDNGIRSSQAERSAPEAESGDEDVGGTRNRS
jgi:UDP-N-acetylmuramate--alanine ligase